MIITTDVATLVSFVRYTESYPNVVWNKGGFMSFPANHVCIVAKTRGSLQFDMSGKFSMFMASIYQQKHRGTSIFPALFC